MAAEGKMADLVLGNNVLAQVPDLNSFVAGIPHILKPTGTVTIEFPHLMRMLEENQFDTIYHEHFCYFSLISAEAIFAGHGMTIFDVEELWTHGGSLRIYARHTRTSARPVTERRPRVASTARRLPATEDRDYTRFEEQVRETKRKLLELLTELKRAGKTIVGYGAPGKGNTLLNYCGIRTDFVDFTVDRTPTSRVASFRAHTSRSSRPSALDEAKPDYILILPWNFKDEILAQLAHVRGLGREVHRADPRADGAVGAAHFAWGTAAPRR